MRDKESSKKKMSSPRIRRLAADYQSVKSLCRESSILDLSCSGDPPSTYLLKFRGHGLAMDPNKGPYEHYEHEVRVRLGSNYPRLIPELHWLTPIFHPNISANGLVCLGGYSTNWVPSLKLDDLCIMLWDMIRYNNFDTTSPYNRLAAEWARGQRQFILPLDSRPLRDQVVAQGGGDDRPPAADPAIHFQATPSTYGASGVELVPEATVAIEQTYAMNSDVVDVKNNDQDPPEIVFL